MAEGFELRDGIDIFVPGGGDWRQALGRVTHLGIGAHADDLEFMAYAGIETCRQGGGFFGGVTVTDGAGSVGGGADLVAARREEQRAAAEIGGYGVMIQLGWPSAEVRKPGALAADLAEIFAAARPRVVYTHNPADRHGTHVAVCRAVIQAWRLLPLERRPERILGCEVWRDLDWLTEGDRVRLDCGRDEEFATKLNAVFRSQIEGGKCYDRAVRGRRQAQATFDDPHAVDATDMVTLAMDLTPLMRETSLPVADYVASVIDRFREDVLRRLR
jgi:LmbE family N-acetylglucosaminyl deacetylase